MPPDQTVRPRAIRACPRNREMEVAAAYELWSLWVPYRMKNGIFVIP